MRLHRQGQVPVVHSDRRDSRNHSEEHIHEVGRFLSFISKAIWLGPGGSCLLLFLETEQSGVAPKP